MSLSIWQILLVVVLFMLLFGRGKIPALMTDLAIGIKNFKKGMNDIETESSTIKKSSASQTKTPSKQESK